MRILSISVVALSFVIVPPAAFAEDPDFSQHYLLLATKKTSTMEKEFTQAAAAGYGVAWGSPTSGSEVMLIMEKSDEADQYDYKLLATTRTGTMTEEMNEAAAQGFRVLPSTLMGKKGFMGNVEILVVMEKGPEAEALAPVEYLLLATSRTKTLQEEMSQTHAGGFRMLAVASRDEHLAIMERGAGQ